METSRVTPAHALSVYAEPLAVGRRVVVVGDATEGLGDRLAELGARLVHVYDPDADRAARAAPPSSRTVAVRALPAADFDVRDGAFDLALVPDLGALSDPASLVARLRRLVGNEGAALFAARNPEATGAPAEGAGGEGAEGRPLDYYELYDLVSMQFASVRMVGQMPFTGVTLAELGETDEEPAVSVETQLAPPTTPQAFVAVASQQDVRLDPYTIVQLPSEAALAPAAAVDTRAIERAQVEIAEARLRAELLEAQLEEQRAQATRQAAEEAPRLAELRAELSAQATKVREAEARAGDNHVRAERLTHDIRALEEELERQRERGFRLTRDVEDEKKARQKAELELGMVRKNPELASIRERVSALEEALRASEEVTAVLQARSGELEAALAEANRELGNALHELSTARQRLAETTQLLEERTQQAAAYAHDAAVLAAEVEQLRAAPPVTTVPPAEIDALVARAERAERRLAGAEQELAGVAEAHASELSHLEEVLRERARSLQGMEAEITRRERLVQELVSTLEEKQALPAAWIEPTEPAPSTEAPPPAAPAQPEGADVEAWAQENAELRAKLDALALEAARREADVQSSAWRIAELEQALAARESSAAEPPLAHDGPGREDDTPARLMSALEELDVLRRALAQEHEARRQSESAAAENGTSTAVGEELARARVELQRQATLIEQLSRELEKRDRSDMAEARHER